jgi:hypothetical protein
MIVREDNHTLVRECPCIQYNLDIDICTNMENTCKYSLHQNPRLFAKNLKAVIFSDKDNLLLVCGSGHIPVGSLHGLLGHLIILPAVLTQSPGPEELPGGFGHGIGLSSGPKHLIRIVLLVVFPTPPL